MTKEEKLALFSGVTVTAAGVAQLLQDTGHKEVADSVFTISEHLVTITEKIRQENES